MVWLRYVFMWILCLGLIIGLGYGIMETIDLVKYIAQNGLTMEIIREPLRGVSLAALELAVLGQSYVVTRDFIGREDTRAEQQKKN